MMRNRVVFWICLAAMGPCTLRGFSSLFPGSTYHRHCRRRRHRTTSTSTSTSSIDISMISKQQQHNENEKDEKNRRLLPKTRPESSQSDRRRDIVTALMSTAKGSSSSSVSAAGSKITKGPKPIFLTHERDYFRQISRLESMDSYVLVSTLTASMSFGALLGFSPIYENGVLPATMMTNPIMKFIYQAIVVLIPPVSGISSLCGLYATLVFSLTILYGKSALGAERDREYDKLIRKTVRARVHGARSFLLSLGLFAVEAFLVLVERTFNRLWCTVSAVGVSGFIMYHLYRDWRLLYDTAESIFKD